LPPIDAVLARTMSALVEVVVVGLWPICDRRVRQPRPATTVRAACRHLAKNAKSDQTKVEFHLSSEKEVKVSHASMLKARRQHQKTKKLLDVAAKQAKRLAKEALAGPAVKKEKVKKVKMTKEELGRQDTEKKSTRTEQKSAS